MDLVGVYLFNSHPCIVSAKPQAVSIWDDREFVAAIAIAGVAFIILMLLMLAICLLIFYHRKVNKLNKYGLGTPQRE